MTCAQQDRSARNRYNDSSNCAHIVRPHRSVTLGALKMHGNGKHDGPNIRSVMFSGAVHFQRPQANSPVRSRNRLLKTTGPGEKPSVVPRPIFVLSCSFSSLLAVGPLFSRPEFSTVPHAHLLVDPSLQISTAAK